MLGAPPTMSARPLVQRARGRCGSRRASSAGVASVAEARALAVAPIRMSTTSMRAPVRTARPRLTAEIDGEVRLHRAGTTVPSSLDTPVGSAGPRPARASRAARSEGMSRHPSATSPCGAPPAPVPSSAVHDEVPVTPPMPRNARAPRCRQRTPRTSRESSRPSIARALDAFARERHTATVTRAPREVYTARAT